MEIRVQNLEFGYAGAPGFNLRVARWELSSGQCVALTGPSGSGKTTLLRLLAGMLVPQRGHIHADAQPLAALSDAQRRAFRIRRVGFVFQDFRLLDYLDVRQNLLLPYRINDALPMDEAVHARLETLAHHLGIAHRLGHNARDLSHGEKQRAAVARALLPGPRLLLADEPTGSLDPDNAGRLASLLLEHARESGATLVAATHDPELARRFDGAVSVNTLAAL